MHKLNFNLPPIPKSKGEITMPPMGNGEEMKDMIRQYQMARELDDMIQADKSNAKLSPLPNLKLRKHILKNWDKYRAYGVPRMLKDIADIVGIRPFQAIYPQTFTPIAKHYLDRGISPAYTVHEDEDHNFGVLTIATMIALVDNGIQWRLHDVNDIPVILNITYQYKTMLQPYAFDNVPDNEAKSYYYKVDKFIAFMERHQYLIEQEREREGSHTGSDISDIFRSIGMR